MIYIDWSTVITTSIAVIAPSFVSVWAYCHQLKINEQNNQCQLKLNEQNNKLQLDLKHLDYYYSEKTLAISDYIISLTNYLDNQTNEALSKYHSSMIKASMFVSKTVYDCFEEIEQYLHQKQFDKARQILNDVLPQTLNIEVQQYK